MESEFISLLVVLVTKEWRIEPISAENASEENNAGKIDFNGFTKSSCCEVM